MTRRETRVVNAFANCVKSGEFTEDYAITLIEDNQRYGWMSEEAKEAFYAELDNIAAEKERNRIVEEAMENQTETDHAEQITAEQTVESNGEDSDLEQTEN